MTRKVCIECKTNLAEKKGKRHFYKKCTTCRKRGKSYNRRPYHAHKKDHCECCGFVPVHPCQLDVDHIDGNRRNNDLCNLKTLCANCHRLKTMLNGDNLNSYTDEDKGDDKCCDNVYNLSLF